MGINPIRLSDYWVLTKNPLNPIEPKKNIPKFNLAIPILKKKKKKKRKRKWKNPALRQN